MKGTKDGLIRGRRFCVLLAPLFGKAGKEIMMLFSADPMKAWPITPRVNSPRKGNPRILEPKQ
jgi:hypothetical protein